MNENFMKEKEIFPLLMSMALPMVISMLVNSLYNIVDSFFVAKISEDAMTALSLVYPIQNLINAAGIGFGIGINAIVSYYLGAGDREKADRAASQGVSLSVIHGLVLTVASIAVMPLFLRMFTSSQELTELGIQYSTVAFAFTVINMLCMAFEKIFQAVGRMKVSMFSLMGGCIVNIVLDPLMIFGVGPFPAMGLRGAALATGIGQTFSLACYLVVYVVRPLSVSIRRHYLRITGEIAGRLYSVGVPAILNLALPSLLISALNAILSVYSGIYILILGIYYKLQTFIYLPANGIIQGMRPLVGYNYGAGEHERVKKLYRTVLYLTGSIMVIGTLLCFLMPERLIGLFTSSSETIQAGAEALRIISIGFPLSAFSVTSSGALEGLGKGGPSLIISLCRYTIVILPAAFILSRLLGPAGVWNAFWVTEAAAAVISVAVYRRAVAIKG